MWSSARPRFRRFQCALLLLTGALLTVGVYPTLFADVLDAKDRQMADLVQAKYGSRAARRVIDWRLLVQRAALFQLRVGA